MNTPIATYAAIVLYFTCTTLIILKLQRHRLTTSIPRTGILLLGLLGVAAHAYALYVGLFSTPEVNLGFYNALSLISAFIALFTLATAFRYGTEALLVMILPTAIVMILLDANLHSSKLLAPGSSDALVFHIISSLIAYSILALAAMIAIGLSVQNRYLHNHRPSFVNALPPLKTMENLLFEALTVGFICLSISLASGLMFIEDMFTQELAHKTVLSIIAWFVFLILLIGRWVLGWRGRIAIRWTLVGFFSLMLAYFGSKFVLEVILH